MNLVRISSSILKGTISIPPSKSITHRAIICAALSNGVSKISPIFMSSDVCATIKAISNLGAKIFLYGNSLIVDSTCLMNKKKVVIDCDESASTLRFLIPIIAAKGIEGNFIGRGSLPKRPLDIYYNCLSNKGVEFKLSTNNFNLPLKVSGLMKSGKFKIPGNVSSQFISGILLAAPITNKEVEIELTTPLESASYVNLTLSVMKEFGIKVEQTKYGWYVPGNQSYSSCDYFIESDWSQAAFFMAAGAIGGKVCLNGLNINSEQPDKKIVDIMKQIGANISWDNNSLLVSHNNLNSFNIDVSQIPDLVPILSVIAAFSNNETIIGNASRLRIKESDRLNAICLGLSKLGATITQNADSLHIIGKDYLSGGYVSGFNDHRIVMALAIAALNATDETIISHADSIDKSYPSFFKDYNSLGGNANIFNN